VTRAERNERRACLQNSDRIGPVVLAASLAEFAVPTRSPTVDLPGTGSRAGVCSTGRKLGKYQCALQHWSNRSVIDGGAVSELAA
jgi:hypothetical protein